jgi:hypothetical protein
VLRHRLEVGILLHERVQLTGEADVVADHPE